MYKTKCFPLTGTVRKVALPYAGTVAREDRGSAETVSLGTLVVTRVAVGYVRALDARVQDLVPQSAGHVELLGVSQVWQRWACPHT